MPDKKPVLTMVNHSPALFWWPVWVIGFVCALLPGSYTSAGGLVFAATVVLVAALCTFSTGEAAVVVFLLAIAAYAALVAGIGNYTQGLAHVLGVQLGSLGILSLSSAAFLIWGVRICWLDRRSRIDFYPDHVTIYTEFGYSFSSRRCLILDVSPSRGAYNFFQRLLLGLGTQDLRLRVEHCETWVDCKLENVLLGRARLRKLEAMVRDGRMTCVSIPAVNGPGTKREAEQGAPADRPQPAPSRSHFPP
jgi:hypothetical protein